MTSSSVIDHVFNTGYHILHPTVFLFRQIPVSHQGDVVAFSLNDPVDDVAPVLHHGQDNVSPGGILSLREGNTLPAANDEREHTATIRT